MNFQAIKAILVREGNKLWKSKTSLLEFTAIPEYDRLINDIENHPHAFVLACLMSQQVQAAIPFKIPQLISDKLGNFEFSTLSGLSEDRWIKLHSEIEPRHRFPNKMAKLCYLAIQRIKTEYDGDAKRIWEGKPSSAEIVYRFLRFKGVGIKIATMTTNSLARDFKIPMSDYYSIDISPDVHVRRVFKRLELIPDDASDEELIYKARALNPEYPGLLDLPVWQIGVEWCRPRKPKCGVCYMKRVCPVNLK